jgi:mannan endo-1,4-beta-mannosidase
MKDYWDKGGLVSIHMPIPNPKNKSHQHDRDMTDEEFRTIAVEGSEINCNFLQWLDRLAKHIDWLQKRGVAIFIRPFHEMNGDWFWYGKRNPDDFKKLFRYTVKYLTEQEGLHNLIVVYSTARRDGGGDYYPGDAFVDIVGVDTYHDPPVAIQEEYNLLIGLKKPFALTEVGWHARNKTLESSRDAKGIIDGMQESAPDAVWWTSWVDSNSPANQKNCKELYDHPLVITRREVDWKRQGDASNVMQTGAN